jgi:hypothetical protein
MTVLLQSLPAPVALKGHRQQGFIGLLAAAVTAAPWRCRRQSQRQPGPLLPCHEFTARVANKPVVANHPKCRGLYVALAAALAVEHPTETRDLAGQSKRDRGPLLDTARVGHLAAEHTLGMYSARPGPYERTDHQQRERSHMSRTGSHLATCPLNF